MKILISDKPEKHENAVRVSLYRWAILRVQETVSEKISSHEMGTSEVKTIYE